MLEGGKSGVLFKWINKNEIYKKYNNKKNNISVSKYLNKLHIEYIGTRPGTIIDFNIEHGLFGIVYSDDDELIDLENLTMNEIINLFNKRNSKDIDVFKTVFSLSNEDSIRYGVNKETWKDVIRKRISDIARASNISPDSIEWTASFHTNTTNPHCHLVFWNKNQNLELHKRPFLNFKEIRKCISKEIFREELEKLYYTKNISKKEISKMTKEELKLYKDSIRQKLKRDDLIFNEIDTEKEERLIQKILNKLKVGNKIYLYNKNCPEEFTEITKDVENIEHKYYRNVINESRDILRFKNNSVDSFLYKNDDFTDTACFLANFTDIGICKSKEELEKIIKEKDDKDYDIDLELREIMPSIIPNNILSYNFREKSFKEISERIASLENLIKKENKKAGLEEKITFRYDLQQPDVKDEIDKITILILNTSKDCKFQFNNYISSSLDIARFLGNVENKYDYEKIKEKSKKEAFNKIGNQVLQALRESINENKKEFYVQKKREYEEKYRELEIKSEEYKKNLDNYMAKVKAQETKELIENIFNMLNTDNISQNARAIRLKNNFNNMTKEQIREYLKIKENSSGFEWFD